MTFPKVSGPELGTLALHKVERGETAKTRTATGAKRIKEEVLSDHEPSMAAIPELEHLGLSDDEDVYVPAAIPNPYTSEAESQAEDDDDDDGNESDGALRALVARAKQARAEPSKWDADAKRARWNEKYGDMDVEEAVAAMSKKWRSTAYEHFHPPKIVTDNRGDVFCRFICKSDRAVYLDRIIHEDSTSNLIRHIRACSSSSGTASEAQALTAFAAGSTYTESKFRYHLVMWVTTRHRPFSIVEDPEFRALLRMLYGRVDIPSRITVTRDMHLILEDARTHLTGRLRSLPGKIHLCVDGWTSPNFMSFLGVTAHWVSGATLQHVTLDFIKLNKAHTGAYLGAKLIKSLKSYGIEKKIMAVTCDNAANNKTMLKEMHILVPEFRGNETRVRCFGHVLNLVVKAILSQFTARAVKKAGKQTTNDFDRVLKDLGRNSDDEEGQFSSDEDEDEGADGGESGDETDEARDAADALEIAQLDEEQEDIELTAEETRSAKAALEKIMKLASKVFCSPHARSELAKLAKAKNLKCETLVRPVRTRWNTVTCVLGRAIDLSPVLEPLCDMHQFNKDPKRGLRLRRFIVLENEWDVLKDLHRLLDPFLFATNQISSNRHALIQDVIPFIDVLTEHVEKFKADTSVSRVVRAAAARGRIILDRYYSRTDEVAIYRVAMMLHPAYKDAYFNEHNWLPEWITESHRLIRKEWQAYKPSPAPPQGLPPPVAPPARPGHLSAARSTRALFKPIAARAAASAKDALEEYLALPVIETVEDPIAYWDSVLRSSNGNPGAAALARMALDFLTVPATSTDAERAFSRGGLTVSRLRHSLNDASVRASALLASWASVPDLISEPDTITLLKTHIRKNRGGRDGGDGPPGGPAGGLAGANKSSHATSATLGLSRAGSKNSRPSTPSGVPGPSVPKPKAISRSSSTASLKSDSHRKDQKTTRALLAASGSKKARHAGVSAGKARARKADEVVEISSDSE
ncbi:hypothetical protein GSI_01986 [Ganoderma sinense ZZ0214-1]|uniref:HAT C-terminal dimerisation domain-containing protein n=1 Tax=Ganoderma sinense ZZ0214-1 TaxID=1077348 RepID=A0A2G8SNC4_9APHY|nr:hypothetical protein GSI_01986 [Ganoderma sinense ZZ0214-1]